MKLIIAITVAAACLLAGAIIVPSRAAAQTVCIEIITCACNDDTGDCQEFGTPCDVPEGWSFFSYSFCPAVSGVSSCLDVISYARDPDSGECVEFPTACTPDGWDRCSGSTSSAK